jgi:hypothetical protein
MEIKVEILKIYAWGIAACVAIRTDFHIFDIRRDIKEISLVTCRMCFFLCPPLVLSWTALNSLWLTEASINDITLCTNWNVVPSCAVRILVFWDVSLRFWVSFSWNIKAILSTKTLGITKRVTQWRNQEDVIAHTSLCKTQTSYSSRLPCLPFPVFQSWCRESPDTRHITLQLSTCTFIVIVGT